MWEPEIRRELICQICSLWRNIALNCAIRRPSARRLRSRLPHFPQEKLQYLRLPNQRCQLVCPGDLQVQSWCLLETCRDADSARPTAASP